MTTKQLNIKNRTYYFYNDLINVLNFEASNLKLHKKTWKGIDIYYIGYTDKKPDWNINSVNPLYLLINRVFDDSVPLNKLIYFPTITVIIRCVFKQNGVFYPQVYLDECLYQI